MAKSMLHAVEAARDPFQMFQMEILFLVFACSHGDSYETKRVHKQRQQFQDSWYCIVVMSLFFFLEEDRDAGSCCKQNLKIKYDLWEKEHSKELSWSFHNIFVLWLWLGYCIVVLIKYWSNNRSKEERSWGSSRAEILTIASLRLICSQFKCWKEF